MKLMTASRPQSLSSPLMRSSGPHSQSCCTCNPSSKTHSMQSSKHLLWNQTFAKSGSTLVSFMRSATNLKRPTLPSKRCWSYSPATLKPWTGSWCWLNTSKTPISSSPQSKSSWWNIHSTVSPTHLWFWGSIGPKTRTRDAWQSKINLSKTLI